MDDLNVGRVVIEVEDLFKPELRGSKFVPILITGNTPAINATYFLNRDVDIDNHVITGIEATHYEAAGNNEWPQQFIYKGTLYNQLNLHDLKLVIMNYRNKHNRYVLRNCPLQFFQRGKFELPFFNVRLDLASSYLKFTGSPLTTPLPIIIPVTYYFDRVNIFK